MITGGGYYDEENDTFPLIVPQTKSAAEGLPMALPTRYTDARMERAAQEGEKFARHLIKTGIPPFLVQVERDSKRLHAYADSHFTVRKFTKGEKLIAISHFVETFIKERDPHP